MKLPLGPCLIWSWLVLAVAGANAAGPEPRGPAARPPLTKPPADLAPFRYRPEKIPFYSPTGPGRRTVAPIETMQEPLEPEESRRHAITPAGFHVELFATEKLVLGKPLAFAFGRDAEVYVVETADYPNDLVEPGQGEGRDRIVRLADTDGDGQADARTVFAEGLSIPTSMLPHAGGLIVTMPPLTLFLQDTDGDGRADVRRTLFEGWGTRDTHAGPSNLSWGLDGWVYGMVGYAGFDGTVGGERHQFHKGFFRFLPDGARLEFLRSTTNNSWGCGFSEEGLLFGSTANGNPSEHMPLANRVYERVRGWSAATLTGLAGSPLMEVATRADGSPVQVRQVDNFGKFTAAAGHRLYTARAWPRDYWNRAAFVCEPTGHVVATFELAPRGAGFTSRMAWSQVASDDEWTAPIQAEVGPDGQLWVIDWYNFIVQHNPTPAGFRTGRRGAYETPLRDRSRGRIWRVVHEGGAAPAPTGLPDDDPAALVAALRDDNLYWRERAQRRLVDRGERRSDGGRDVVPALVALVGDGRVDEIGLAPAAIHALWTLRLLGAVEGPAADPAALAAVRGALAHPSAGVRLNAVKVLPRDPAAVAALVAAGSAADEADLVRLAVLEAASELPASAEAGDLVVAMLRDPRTLADPVLADAATAAAAVQSEAALPALLAPDTPSRRAWQVITERVAEHVARGGDCERLAAAVVRLPAVAPELAAAVAAGLARGWPADGRCSLGADAEAALREVVARLPAAAQGQLVTLARKTGSAALDFQVEQISRRLVAVMDDSSATAGDRARAAERLVALLPADAAAVTTIMDRVSGRTDPEVAAGFVEAVGRSSAAAAAALLLDRLAALTPPVRAAAVRAVLARREWGGMLADRLETGRVSMGDIPIADRQKLLVHPDGRVRERAKRILAAGGGLPNADRQKVIDEILPVVQAGGDATRGSGLFREQCGKCHRHGTDGGRVGPDLTGMAAHPAHELLIHILDPDRSVEGNYRAYTVTTDEGRVVTGLLAGESRTAVEIVDAEGKIHAIQRAEIDGFAPSPSSLMPVGFEKQISPQGFADLLAFLTTKTP